MHRYFPHTAEDEAQMLGVVGADRVEDLFAPSRRIAATKARFL